ILHSHIHIFFFQCYGHPRALHSFPTRRSSDLQEGGLYVLTMHPFYTGHRSRALWLDKLIAYMKSKPGVWFATHEDVAKYVKTTRSEEHTSELQSRGHLVCRLLLEKKKKQRRTE